MSHRAQVDSSLHGLDLPRAPSFNRIYAWRLGYERVIMLALDTVVVHQHELAALFGVRVCCATLIQMHI